MSRVIDLINIINGDDENTGFLGVNEYLGMGYIKSYLETKDYQVNIYVLKYANTLSIKDYLGEEPFLVGFSVYSDNVNQTLEIAHKLKVIYPNVHITLGGPQVNNYEENILQENPFIDTIISHEGELTFEELANTLNGKESLSVCKGITYRDKYNIIKNEMRKPIKDLDSLPLPNRDIYETVRQKYMYIVGSRGCLGGCSFCGETSTKACMEPPYVRLRSAASIVDEMEYLVRKYKINSFRLTDATFEDPGADGFKRANEIFDNIISRKLEVSLHLFTRANLVINETEEYFKKAKEAGVECFYIGIEAGNDKDLNFYHKKSKAATNSLAIQKVRNSGIHVGIGYICFNPFSTYETLIQNADFLHSTHLGHVFYLLQTRLEVLPQAFVRKKLIEENLIFQPSYRTHFYDYQFKDPKIGKLYRVIKKAYTVSPIYYMDTITSMDRVWINKNLADYSHCRLNELYKKLDDLCHEYSEKNYIFFIKCIEMSANGATDNHMDKLIDDFRLFDIYPKYEELYNNINIRVTKERMKKMYLLQK